MQLIQPTTWHRVVAFFANSLADRLALLNNSFRHYPTLLTRGKDENHLDYASMFSTKIYKTSNPTYVIKSIRDFLEYNTTTNFNELTKKSVKITVFDSSIQMDTLTQKQPDVIANFKHSNFTDQRVHGIDQKVQISVGIGKSKILVGLTREQYERTLGYFANELEKLGIMTDNARLSLERLSRTCTNLTEHQMAWAEVLHHFPVIIPPIRVPHNVCLEEMKPEFIQDIEKSGVKLSMISNFLIAKKIPAVYKDRMTEEIKQMLNRSYREKLDEWAKKGWLEYTPFDRH